MSSSQPKAPDPVEEIRRILGRHLQAEPSDYEVHDIIKRAKRRQRPPLGHEWDGVVRDVWPEIEPLRATDTSDLDEILSSLSR